MRLPPDPEERRRRRALLKAHHPDLGGDPEEFIRVAANFQAALSGRPTTSAPAHAHRAEEVRFVPTPHGLGRIAAWYARQRLKRLRRRSPRVL